MLPVITVMLPVITVMLPVITVMLPVITVMFSATQQYQLLVLVTYLEPM